MAIVGWHLMSVTALTVQSASNGVIHHSRIRHSDYSRPTSANSWVVHPFTFLLRTPPRRIRHCVGYSTPFVSLLALQRSSDDVSTYANNMDESSSRDGINRNSTLSPPDSDTATLTTSTTPSSSSSSLVRSSMSNVLVENNQKEMELMWCDANVCKDDLRERATEGGRIVMRGPATGQVAYHWMEAAAVAAADDTETTTGINNAQVVTEHSDAAGQAVRQQQQQQQCVLFLVKQGSDNQALLAICADAVRQLTSTHGAKLSILLDPSTAARLQHYHGVNGPHVHLFEATPCRGFGNNVEPDDVAATEFGSSTTNACHSATTASSTSAQEENTQAIMMTTSMLMPNLIVTIGGDGLLMHAGMMFQGPMPPILCVAGGSLGFLTPFSPAEMVPAIELSLGLVKSVSAEPKAPPINGLQVFPPNMLSYPYDDVYEDAASSTSLNDSPSSSSTGSSTSSAKNDGGDGEQSQGRFKFPFGVGDVICLSIRMRLDCRIITRQGAVKARYNVLNEVVVDRGSSPYLAALECFCDDAHLTTVQADGVIFATPTGSTAYSLAAGSSVVHPAVPCILVTPICPHVLSFRSMVFPDHVVLRCYVPHDARADASVAFDGKHRQELHRGDSVQIQLSAHPVPTINRKDHSADWLGSLKRSFNFNSRPRQRPL